jgi:hypothetical protein
MVYPSYLNLTEEQWKERIEKALSLLESCEVCPHRCGVNRLKGELGFCKTGKNAIVDSYFPHRGRRETHKGLQRFWNGIFLLLQHEMHLLSELSDKPIGRRKGGEP